MSCDGNREKFFMHAAQHKAVQDAFGSPENAVEALENIFNTARSRVIFVSDRSSTAQAEARTRKLFDEMKAVGIKPPTHSPSGLPRRDAQFGYSAVAQTLENLRNGRTLPILARQVLERSQRTRQISSVSQDGGGYMRCANCGRFAARSGGHICPATASKETLSKHLTRRFGVPVSAYGEGLETLLSEARANGTVSMRHGLTGEIVDVSLDGLPLALSTGFIPRIWTDKNTAVELADGRVIHVLDASGLNPIQPAGNAVSMASATYGLVTNSETIVGSALAADLAHAHNRTGAPLAAADSAYIAMKNSVLSSGQILNLGGSVSSSRCPKCGRYMGDGHICPNENGDTRSTTAIPAFEIPTFMSQPSVNVDVQVDTSPIADAIRNAAPAQVILDGDAFAQSMQKGLGAINIPAPIATPAVSSMEMTELKIAMTEMAQAIGTLAKKGGSGKTKDAHAEDRLVEVTEKLAASLASSRSPSSSSLGRCLRCGQLMDEDHTCPPRMPRAGKPVTPADQLTAQEHIFAPLVVAAPDPYLLNVPEGVGGQLQQSLEEFIPMPDPNFEINAQTEMIMRAISSTMQLGANKDRMSWTRAIGLYGPPGTGKNTIARQVAASVKTVDRDGNLSQGMNYVEANITPESSMQELIGTTVLETDPTSGSTVSRTRLGKIGLAAAMGSVVCINEMVRNPKLATALQSMLEDGEIQIDSPEQGMIRIPVHPSTIFVMTWNPGYEGDPERPGQAPLSRMMPLRMDRASAEEQARRVDSFFASVRGEKTEVDSISARRREILARDYAIPKDITPTQEEIKTAVRFFGEVATLAGGGIGDRQIGLNSDSPTAPGQRQLNRYIALGKTVGWNDALETLKISCDQDDQYENQWSLVRERFEAHFGTDGAVLNRTAPEQN